LLVIPLGLAVWGANTLDHGALPTAGLADVIIIAAGIVLAIGLGALRGCTMAVYPREGVLWARSTGLTMAVWGASIAARVPLAVAAHVLGADVAASGAVLVVLLGLTLGAQNLIVYVRGASTGLPFAPRSRRARSTA
jgi:hypothetical protein